MKKFANLMLSLMLVIALTFSFVACEEPKNDEDPDNGNNQSTEQELKPVETKTFVTNVLENIAQAEGLTLTLTAALNGSASVKTPAAEENGEPTVEETTFNESVETEPLEIDCSYAEQILSAVSELDFLFTGTVPVNADKNGYEYTLSIKTADVQMALAAINAFLIPAADVEGVILGTTTIGELLEMVLPEKEDGSAWTASEWLTQLFASATFNAAVAQLDTVLVQFDLSVKDLVGLISEKAGLEGIDYDAFMTENGAKTPAEVIDGLLGDGVFETISGVLMSMIDSTITEVYDSVVLMVAYNLGLPFAPTSAVLATAKITTADLELKIVTDKDMNLVSFAASIDFDGFCVSEGVTYAADITASASGTFTYGAVEAAQAA